MSIYCKWIAIPLILLLLPSISVGKIVVVNGLTHTFKLDQGARDRGIIQLKNVGDESKSVLIYQTDYTFNHKGETFYKDPGTGKRSNADWLEISPLSVTLAPGEERTVTFTIRVPDSSGLQGSYWSAIMVEPSDIPDTPEQEEGVRIRSVFRYAVQIISDVNGPGVAELDFIDITLNQGDKESSLEVDVLNKGGQFLSTTINVEIFDEAGNSLGVFSSKRSRTLPGTSRRYLVSIPRLEKGVYEAMLIADSGEGEAFGIQLSLEIEDD